MDGVTVLIAAVSAVAGAFIGGVLPILIGEKWLRPKLYILNGSVIPAIFNSHHRILVKNRGRRAAQNCIGMITLDDATAQDVWEPPHTGILRAGEPQPILTKGYFTKIEAMSLCWSRLENPEALIINRDTSQALEFYRVYYSDGAYRRLEIPSEQGWQHFRVSLKIDKEYHGKIEVTSANAKPAWASFKLVPDNGDVRLVITKRKPSWEEPK